MIQGSNGVHLAEPIKNRRESDFFVENFAKKLVVKERQVDDKS